MAATQTQSVQDHHKRLLTEWFQLVWEQGDRTTIQRIYGTNAVLHDGKRKYRGPGEFLHFYDALTTEFSRFKIEPILDLAEDDLACKHFLVKCTHTKTQTPVEFTAIVIVRIANGQFTEAWQNWDTAEVMRQIPGFAIE